MRWLLLPLLLVTLALPADAATIQARLVGASNEPAAPATELADVEPALREKFGYKTYRLLGADQGAINAEKLTRLDVKQGFTVFAKVQGEESGQLLVLVEWYSCKVLLVRTTVRINPQQHVFIKGPDVGRGSINLVVTRTE